MTDTSLPYTKAQWGAFRALFQHDRGATAMGLDELPQDTIEKLLERAHTHHLRHPDATPRFFPSTFTGESANAPYAIPFPVENPWSSLERLIETFNPKHGVMLIAPLYWQTEPIFNEVCKRHELPESVIHGSNLPVAVEILKQVGMRGVVLESSLVEPFMAEVRESYDLTQIDFILAVTPLSQAHHVPLFPTTSTLLFHEIHISPGCPLISQRVTDAGTAHYRLNPDFIWELEGKDSHITAYTARTLPALRFATGLELEATSEADNYVLRL